VLADRRYPDKGHDLDPGIGQEEFRFFFLFMPLALEMLK